MVVELSWATSIDLWTNNCFQFCWPYWRMRTESHGYIDWYLKCFIKIMCCSDKFIDKNNYYKIADFILITGQQTFKWMRRPIDPLITTGRQHLSSTVSIAKWMLRIIFTIRNPGKTNHDPDNWNNSLLPVMLQSNRFLFFWARWFTVNITRFL